MPNTRVFYPCHYIAISPNDWGSGFSAVHGVQTVSLQTTFNLQQTFELGQLEIYENLETVPSIELSIEKVLDGYPLIYHLATQGATSKTLLNRSNRKCDAVLSIFSDAQDSSSGTAVRQALVSGLFINSLSYAMRNDGSFTESVTLVGNDKAWRSNSFFFTGAFDNTDAPASGVQRRQNVKMGSGLNCSVFPTDIPGLTANGTGSGYNHANGSTYNVHFQNISISCNLNRNSLFELGKRREFYKFAQFPTQVTCEISILAAGSNPSDGVNAVGDSTANLTDQSIVIKLDDSTVFDLGRRNKLSSISYSGGDASGGEVTISYSYSNFNTLNITQNSDPAGFTSPYP